MPWSTSSSVIFPTRPCRCWPSSPYQFVRSASTVVGWAMIAGVQSTVWILAMSAAFTSRALS